ncbi:hypothetical protein PGT21_033251 [Puccinia graminis f. sp. tritici]|uniref:Uncharacterized protein n=1 Tax=Puccinia graminis f. sp. tritici TaxID=56615 RepID=A0A5B0NDW4_PUCGR|nr:hypothetical protein PGT21_033251 [Puccinia graminis f. sp. tritici]
MPPSTQDVSLFRVAISNSVQTATLAFPSQSIGSRGNTYSYAAFASSAGEAIFPTRQSREYWCHCQAGTLGSP